MTLHRLRARSRRPGDPARDGGRSAWTRSRGQALAEFAIILPLMLAMFGTAIDVARVFQTWMRLQEVTRDTAELIASDTDFDPVNNANYVSLARTTAETLVCNELGGCADAPPRTRVTDVQVFPAPNRVSDRPVWRSVVTAEADFKALFLYPFVRLVLNDNAWTLRSTVTYEVWRGRV